MPQNSSANDNAPNPTRRERLRAATYQDHVALEGTQFCEQLFGLNLPLQSYATLLRAQAVIAETLDEVIKHCPDAAVRSLATLRAPTLEPLHRDLDYFQNRVNSDIAPAVEAAQRMARWIRTHGTAHPLAVIGMLYVYEGSSMGAVILSRQVKRLFGLQGDTGAAYFHAAAAGAASQWPTFATALDELKLTAEGDEEAITGATEFFSHLLDLYQKLYPYTGEDLRITATTLNPRAGVHPVAEDPAVVAAAVAAASDCWRDFPYLQARYGDKGKKFGDSDGAWLAALVDLEDTEMSNQIDWLLGVLATRGMPSSILEHKLALLAKHWPKGPPTTAADRFAAAAKRLRQRRSQQLPAELEEQLSERFAASTRHCPQPGPPDSLRLLLAAIADEAAGVPALKPLRNWITDPDRFDQDWCSAVDELIASAHNQIPPQPK